MKELKIGLSKVDITPPAASCGLQGMEFYRPSKFVESKLYANAVAIEGEEQLIICACDLAGISDELYSMILEKVQEKNPAMDLERITVSATHTHTGPRISTAASPLEAAALPGSKSTYADALPEGYTFVDEHHYDPEVWMGDRTVPYLAERIAEVIVNAWKNRAKGYYSPAFGRCAIGQTRRTLYRDGKVINYGVTNSVNFDALQGGNDSGVELIYFFNENKKPTGAIANVACPSQSMEQNHFICSDFWGKTRDFLEKDLGEDFVLVGLCSAAGDQAPRDLIRLQRPNYLVQPPLEIIPRRGDPEIYSVESCTDIGERLAMEIERVLKKVNPFSDKAIVRYRKIKLSLPGVSVDNDTYKAAVATVREHLEKLGKTVLNTQELEVIRIPLTKILRYKDQEYYRYFDVNAHIMRLGDVVFATNPFELFLDYGNRIKTRSHATQTFLIQLANGGRGYLPTKVAYETGGYGVDFGCKIEPLGGEILTEATISAITEIMQ
ncbi:MAG: hypothetical protein E7390_03640 [Ruminococcaceae bacterium]|nr:hypothetical protein [Oscillospiraceae bacterium]